MRPEGESRVSEVLEENTTVIAPIMARAMPNMSRCVRKFDSVGKTWTYTGVVNGEGILPCGNAL